MNELHLQDKFLIPFFREGLGCREVKANTVTNSLIIEEDLQEFISQTEPECTTQLIRREIILSNQ